MFANECFKTFPWNRRAPVFHKLRYCSVCVLLVQRLSQWFCRRSKLVVHPCLFQPHTARMCQVSRKDFVSIMFSSGLWCSRLHCSTERPTESANPSILLSASARWRSVSDIHNSSTCAPSLEVGWITVGIYIQPLYCIFMVYCARLQNWPRCPKGVLRLGSSICTNAHASQTSWQTGSNLARVCPACQLGHEIISHSIQEWSRNLKYAISQIFF